MKKILLTILLLIGLLSYSVLGLSMESGIAAPPIRINLKSATLVKNQNVTLRVYNAKKNYKLYFKTEEDNIIYLPHVSPKSRKIQIHALEIGTATVKINVRHKKRPIATLTCKIQVTPPAFSVKFKTNNMEMEAGTSLVLKPSIKPRNSSCTPIYTSSDKNVITVNAKGRVRAIDGGQATITARLPNGQSDMCTFTVWDALPWATAFD